MLKLLLTTKRIQHKKDFLIDNIVNLRQINILAVAF